MNPHQTGTLPRETRAREEKSQKTAHAANEFVTQARERAMTPHLKTRSHQSLQPKIK